MWNLKIHITVAYLYGRAIQKNKNVKKLSKNDKNMLTNEKYMIIWFYR